MMMMMMMRRRMMMMLMNMNAGNIPAELSQLISLEYLSLDNNNLSGNKCPFCNRFI